MSALVDQQKNTPPPIWRPWLRDLDVGYHRNIMDRPNYYAHKPAEHLRTSSHIQSLNLGTGKTIYDELEPLLESATGEIILVTCFWARSETLTTLNRILVKLSSRALSTGHRLRVRICFSSSSLFQKLFHPQTPKGKIWTPETWQTTLGLPAPEKLRGLDLQIKSIFLLPFCVMHPKFIVVDRRVAVLPSCNVSWEEWFEGSVTLEGLVVQNFVQFWKEFWAEPDDRDAEIPLTSRDLEQEEAGRLYRARDQEPSPQESSLLDPRSSRLPSRTSLDLKSVDTIFLPSPHHINPRFRFPWQSHALPPPTPLNTFILRALKSADTRIYIQTPNLTSPPVLHAILQTIERGVDVHIVTSERLMILEQLVTAGTTTSRCIRKLVKRYRSLKSTHENPDAEASLSRIEEGHRGIGALKIEFFEPVRNARALGNEPVQSHLKCMIVDSELTVFGSGNLDRASWYTSQELGVAFFDKGFADVVARSLEGVLKGRKKVAFDSGRWFGGYFNGSLRLKCYGRQGSTRQLT